MEIIEQVHMKDVSERLLTEKNRMCEQYEHYFEDLLKVAKGRSTVPTDSLKMRVRVSKKPDQNIT